MATTWLEQQWDQLYEGRNPVLVTTLVSFAMHEVIYFGRYLPFFLCDFIPGFPEKYKIQSTKENTAELQWRCLKQLLFSHFCIQLPMQVGFHPMAELFGMRTLGAFPTWTDLLAQIAFFFVFEDTYHYWMHRALHYGPLYKYIHKQHHDFSAPFGITAEYAHPLETLILGMGTIGGPLLWVLMTGDMHMVTVLAWVAVRLMQTVDAHSGYDFPWSLRNWVPFWAGADFHDYHHRVFLGNYSSTFRWWDWVCGTDGRYNSFKLKEQQQKEKELVSKEE